MLFATLDSQTFMEWRQAHSDLDLPCGAHPYPCAEHFPWPEGFSHRVDSDLIVQPHDSGFDFVRSLKVLGAHEAAPGHRPLPAGTFRRLLNSLKGGFAVTYQVPYGEIFR